jgi:carbamoyl-phosphate synthase large subunit
VLFLVWKHAPIKTTLLKDLEDHCDITYLEFERADELSDGIDAFLRRCARHSFARSFAA